MMQQFLRSLRRCDRVALVCLFSLFAFGATAQYSVGLGQPESGLLMKQVLFFILGLGLFTVFMTVDYRLWQPLYPWLYVASLFLLLLLFTPVGSVIRGVRSWLNFGFFVWQPVEMVKLFCVVALAAYFSKQGRHLYTWKPLIVSGSAIGLMVILTILQPDLGEAIILFLIWLGLVLLLGLSKWQIGLMLLAFTFVGMFGWTFVLKDYQRSRFATFIDPGRDPLGAGYNLTQSIIAIGSGGVFGKGIGYGSQSQLKFLPETKSDFVFAVVGEELGLAGITLLLVLYGIMAWRMIVIARSTRSDFGQILVVGVLCAFLGQALINIGGDMGLLPLTGVPLPFLSSGGSYMLSLMAMMGLMQSVAVHST